MSGRVETAELLIALLVLGGAERLPIGMGALDRSLNACLAVLPPALKDRLTFSRTSVGLRCLELPEILKAASEAMLMDDIPPTYTSARPRMSQDTAFEIAGTHQIAPNDAVAIGKAIYRSILDGHDFSSRMYVECGSH